MKTILLCPPHTHTSPNITFFNEIELEPEVAVIVNELSVAAVGGILATNLHLPPTYIETIEKQYKDNSQTFNNSGCHVFPIKINIHRITGRDKSPNCRRSRCSLQDHVVSIIVSETKGVILSYQRKSNSLATAVSIIH